MLFYHSREVFSPQFLEPFESVEKRTKTEKPEARKQRQARVSIGAVLRQVTTVTGLTREITTRTLASRPVKRSGTMSSGRAVSSIQDESEMSSADGKSRVDYDDLGSPISG
eukprot:gene4846-2991_t